MRLARWSRPSSSGLTGGAAIVAAAACWCITTPAQGARSTFRTYDVEQGLTDVGVSCLRQDNAGFLLMCTQHGIFAYDGRRFINLGTTNGLRDGGQVFNVSSAWDGRLALSYPDEVFVSDRPIDAHTPPSSLSFRPVFHPGISFFNGDKPHRLVPWRHGFAFLADDATLQVMLSGNEPARFEDMGYDRAERQTLARASGVFSVRGHLWEAFDDGRLCLADPGAVKCYDRGDGLGGGPWFDVAAGPDGKIRARSLSSVGTFDPVSGHWSVVDLPDQGGDYMGYQRQLGLFTTPSGEVVTQADHGLDVLRPDGWRTLTVAGGAPAGIITAAETDATGQFWLLISGRGLVRWIGYERWETLQRADGLSADIAWQTARSPDGSIWVATDTGIDRVLRRDGSLQVAEVVPGPSFALTVGTAGDLWSSHGLDGARVIDPATGSVTRIEVPPVDVIAPDPGGAIWIGTETGLFRVTRSAAGPSRHVERMSASRTSILDIKADGAGGIFYIAGNRLRHRHRDGHDVPVSGAWPDGGFEPVAVAIDRPGQVWMAGAGGLFRFTLAGDRVVANEAIPVADTRSNSIPALMVDHRGWVWVGTSLGVSVFNGHNWVSVDADSGLVDDNVAQGGIREDPDGSVWIATARGISHLLDPTRLFQFRPLRVAVTEATIGSRPLTGQHIPYTRDAFSVQLGTPSYGAEQSVRFEYRLSGVDSDWVTSSSGVVRYPFVPPGRHTLTIIGVDDLTHRSSAPASLAIDMAYPWWERWWFEAACVVGLLLAAAFLIHGVVRFRFRAVYARQAELQRLVAEQTARLRFVAAHDKLTGLLTRTEIEERLAARLANGPVDDELVVALVDVDHFKHVNDTHGHLAGDAVLQTLGRLVSRCLRDGEYAGRYGGEEILLVLSDRDGRGADRVLDLHHVIRGSPFPSNGKALRITCSVGIAWAIHDDNWESLLGRADDALYEAKHGGRDQVVEGPRARRTAPGQSGRSRNV